MASPNFSSEAGVFGELSPGIRAGGARYILKRALGRGELSEVWLAQDAKLSKEVALKFLPKLLFSDENVVEQLRQETRRITLLTHPHIVPVYDFVRDYHVGGVAMEYVDGWSLAALKVDKPQQRYHVSEIEWWIRQLCAALDYAHTQFGIIHRDLKPSNLLVTARDELKVTDFGIAQTVRSVNSRRGAVKGAYGGLGFLSPQQVMGADPSKLDDIYSLGATIFDLLTGTPPFYKGEIFAQVCGLKPPAMAERLRELGIKEGSMPPVWEEAVAACLAKEPGKRPQSVNEVLQMLERAGPPKPVEPPAPPPPPPVPAAVPPPVSSPATVSPAAAAEETAPQVIPAAPAEPVAAGPEEIPTGILVPEPKRKPIWIIAATALALVAVLAVAGLAGGGRILRKLKQTTSGVFSSPAALDPAFNPGTGADNELRCVAIQPDGKILVGGKFSTFNGAPQNGLARLDANGALDAAFTPQPRGTVHSIALEADGHILIGGDFTSVSDKTHQRIARLNADGTLDDAFKARCNKEIRALVVQPDGKILAGGSFTSFNGKKIVRLARLDTRGRLDSAFNTGAGASGMVLSFALQPDGKILVGGSFTEFNNAAVGRVVRLNSDGGIDPAFAAGQGADAQVIVLAVQGDGKILVAGDFLTFNNVPRSRIARLNPDGSLDNTFNPGGGLNDAIRGIAVQHDGKIIIGGFFTSVQGAPCNRIARLNPDGSRDPSFDTRQGAEKVVSQMKLLDNGKILAAGAFRTFDGVDCGGIARLRGDSR